MQCHLQGLSIACSTPEAVSWDPSWANSHEISGRAMKNVHDAAEGFQYERRQELKEQRAADDCVGESSSICRSTCTSNCTSTCPSICVSICTKGLCTVRLSKTHTQYIQLWSTQHNVVGYLLPPLVPATSVAAIGLEAECVSVCADNPDGPMQHRSANGIANGVTHMGFDAEAGKVAATATKHVVQGLRATAAAFTPGKQVPAASTATSTVAP